MIAAAQTVNHLLQSFYIIIQSIGALTHQETKYLPYMPIDLVDRAGRRVVEPEFVYLSNLRDTVEKLSDPGYSGDYLENFKILKMSGACKKCLTTKYDRHPPRVMQKETPTAAAPLRDLVMDTFIWGRVNG